MARHDCGGRDVGAREGLARGGRLRDRGHRRRGGRPRSASMVSEDLHAALLAEAFSMLGDPTRVKMISALMAAELCVCDLAALLGVSQSAVSHQLRLLRAMRMVKYRQGGPHGLLLPGRRARREPAPPGTRARSGERVDMATSAAGPGARDSVNSETIGHRGARLPRLRPEP